MYIGYRYITFFYVYGDSLSNFSQSYLNKCNNFTINKTSISNR
jgi:hypothetical protein